MNIFQTSDPNPNAPLYFLPGIQQTPLLPIPVVLQPQMYATSSNVLSATSFYFQTPQPLANPSNEVCFQCSPPTQPTPQIVQPQNPIQPISQPNTDNKKEWTQEQINKVMELGKSYLLGEGKRWVKIAIEVFGSEQSPEELIINAGRCNSKYYHTKSNPSNKIRWDTRLDPKLKNLASQYQPNELGKWNKVSIALFNNISFAKKCKHRYEYLMHKEKEKEKKAQKVAHNTPSQKSDI